MNKTTSKNISTKIIASLLIMAMLVGSIGFSGNKAQAAKSYNHYGVWKLVKKTAYDTCKHTLTIQFGTDPEIDSFHIRTMGERHYDECEGTLRKIGKNKYRGYDEVSGVTFTFKVKKKSIVVTYKKPKNYHDGRWTPLPKGTFKLKKHINPNKVG